MALGDMDEADEYCVGKGYDGAADKLTRLELEDLGAQWRGRNTTDGLHTGISPILKRITALESIRNRESILLRESIVPGIRLLWKRIYFRSNRIEALGPHRRKQLPICIKA